MSSKIHRWHDMPDDYDAPEYCGQCGLRRTRELVKRGGKKVREYWHDAQPSEIMTIAPACPYKPSTGTVICVNTTTKKT